MQDGGQRFRYAIRIRGVLGPTLLGAFEELHAETEAGDTVLRGPLPDQSALHGVLAQIEALGLELVEIGREDATEDGPGPMTARDLVDSESGGSWDAEQRPQRSSDD